ncbi:hypothetical protein BRD17_09480 [Halobacteriales archaeon SW_7_68_16]|nr:MAG: hypothetical protein BRD17_09480 [Halobacteriales archaeon SW_7_68_16]
MDGTAGGDDLARRRARPPTATRVAMLDGDRVVESVDDAFAEDLGYGADDLLGESWEVLFDGDGRDRVRDRVFTALSSEGHWRGELPCLTADGSVDERTVTVTRLSAGRSMWVIQDGDPIVPAPERTPGFTDRTDDLRAIVESLPVIVFAVNTEGTITRMDGVGVEPFELDRDHHIGASVSDLYRDYPAVVGTIERCLTGEEVETSTQIDGRTIELSARPIHNDDGEIVEVVGVARDITERHRREHQLEGLAKGSRALMSADTKAEIAEELAEITRRTLGAPVVGVWSYDETADLLVPATGTEDETARPPADPGTAEMAAFEGDELVVDEYAAFDTPAHPDAGLGTVALVPLGEHGVLRVAATQSVDVTTAERYLLSVLGRNATAALDRAAREQALQDRTEQIEFLNSLLRHDVVNGLMIIRARAAELEDAVGPDHQDAVEAIRCWCADSLDLIEKVRDVLNVVTDRHEDTRAVDTRSIIEDEVERVRSTFPGATVDIAGPNRAVVDADDLLAELFGNVVTNAIEHNEDDATVEITLTEDDDTVTVRIADDGPGIDPEYRDRVFDRGATGIEDAHANGNGFGLYYVSVMVERYGGSVDIERSSLGGAAFVIELPKP